MFLGRLAFSLSAAIPKPTHPPAGALLQLTATEDAVPQDLHDKEEAGEEAEAEQAHPLLDPHAH